MHQIVINTTQNVELNFNLASIGHRFLAQLIDFIIKMAYYLVVFLIAQNIFNFDDMDQWSLVGIISVLMLPMMFYSLFFETLFEGQTLGKKALKIKVLKIDGYQASLGDYMTRWLFRVVEVFWLFSIVGFIAILISKKGQRLGDIAAGTTVVSLKNEVNISHTILEDIKENYIPKYLQVMHLSDNDVQIIKQIYKDAKLSKDYSTLTKLKEKVEEVTKVKSQDIDDLTFIDRVIKDYNFYTREIS